ncbi:hypothetical protein JJB09_00485 [Rhizobium sp. KVB221]|uniref:YcxB-like protein domain-containing protein n=1 Tax=Rhizobium setariae TaxID=2801340 RepID=A0A937CNA4_9HYPH|nr:hypothetical protein [Rhizobium setariae]MBL0370492.1 hypothetical protein [Rhizobium setariae]
MLRYAPQPKSNNLARYEAVNRRLSISFERDPAEHVEVMLSAGRWHMTAPRPRYTWLVLAGAIASGLAIGLLMELYRRFALPLVLDAQMIPTLSVVLFQFLPFVILIAALVLGRSRYLDRLRRQSFETQLETGQFIDTDVYDNGIETTSGDVTVWMPWGTVRDVVVSCGRIEVLGDAFIAYLPERAFPNKEAFHRASVLLADLRLEAQVVPLFEQEEERENALDQAA